MRRYDLWTGLWALLLAGCAAGTPATETRPIAAGPAKALVTDGFALAPVAAINILEGSVDALGFFGDEFHAALGAAFPGTPVASPGEVYASLETGGPDAHSRLRSLRRRLAREEELSAPELDHLSSAIRFRFLLVTFLNESAEEGIHRTNLDDFRSFSYSMGVHRYPTDELHGHAGVFLVDLMAKEVVWRGGVDYHSEGLGEGEAARVAIDRTRADAAFRLAELLAVAAR